MNKKLKLNLKKKNIFEGGVCVFEIRNVMDRVDFVLIRQLGISRFWHFDHFKILTLEVPNYVEKNNNNRNGKM